MSAEINRCLNQAESCVMWAKSGLRELRILLSEGFILRERTTRTCVRLIRFNLRGAKSNLRRFHVLAARAAVAEKKGLR